LRIHERRANEREGLIDEREFRGEIKGDFSRTARSCGPFRLAASVSRWSGSDGRRGGVEKEEFILWSLWRARHATQRAFTRGALTALPSNLNYWRVR